MKKLKNNSLAKLLRKTCAISLMMVLLPHPWTTSARAQQEGNFAQIGMQVVNTVAGTIQQAMMQSQMMRPTDLSASIVKNVPAANLPAPLNKCLIPAAKIPMPRYCEQLGPPNEYITQAGLAASPTYNQFAQTSEFAKSQTITLERMLDMGKNEFANGAITGLQCLEDAKLKEKTRRQGITNAIQARIDQIKLRNEQFKEQVKLVELEMKKIKGELLGSTSGDAQHVSDVLNPPVKNFPPNCQAIVEKANPSEANKLGLYQLKEASFKPAARSGGEFLANQQLYQNDIQRFINEARDYVAKNGIDSFRTNGLPSFKGNQKLLERIGSSIAPFSGRIEREETKIREELKKVGYDAPALDRNFASDFNAFKADSKEYFRKKAVSECVTGADNGLTLDPKTILDALRQESTNNQGTTIITYKAALKTILESDSFVEDKIQALKALDARYGEGNITLTLSNAQAKLERMPPYMYFQNAVAVCTANYNDDKTFSTSNQGRSQATKMERAEAYLNDLKVLHDTFVADMTTTITNDIVNCSGRTVEAGSCSLDGKSFNIADPGFCFTAAQSCATEINNCFAIADQLVKKKTTELNTASDKYNGIVEGLFNDQARFFAEFKSAVMQEAGLLNALVPGADFKFPEDMFISMPELALDPSTNTYIRGGDSQSIGRKLSAVSTKMATLKDALIEQGRAADTQLTKYIAEQKSNMQDNLDAFKELAKSCDEKMTEAEAISRDYIARRMEDEQKAKSAAGDFCRRFYNLSTNPNAACGDVEELYSAANRAAQMATSEAKSYTNDLRNLCTATQSEREAGTEDDANSSGAVSTDIAQACNDNVPWREAIEPYISQYTETLPDDSDSDKIIAYLDSDQVDSDSKDELIASLSQDFKDDRQALRDLRRVLRARNTQAYDSSSFDLYSKLNLRSATAPTSTAPAEETAEARTARETASQTVNQLVGDINNTSARPDVRLGNFKRLNDLALNSPNESLKSLAAAALGGTGDSSLAGKYDNLEKQVKAAQELLPDGTGDSCKTLKADAVVLALNDCLSSSDNSCVKDKYNELIDDGELDQSRNIASLGFTPNNQAGLEDDFRALGETKQMDCDALAVRSRNPFSDTESLDRQVLGDQYDSIMRGR